MKSKSTAVSKMTKTLVAGAILLAVSACSDNAESHLTKAKASIAEHKISESVIELKNTIRLDNKNAEARFLLGKIYLDQGRGDEAVKELYKANELKYPTNKVLPLLARAYILTNADDDVIDLSEQLKALSGEISSEELSHYLAYKTLAALRTEQLEVATKSVELAQQSAESSIYTMLASAYLNFSNKKLDEANTLVSRMLVIDAKQPDTLMLQGQIAIALKNYEQASKSFKAYLVEQPQSGIVQLLLADSLLKENKYDEAEKYADAILAMVATQPFANYIKSMCRYQDKDFAKASEHAELALQANFNQLGLKLVAGASAFHLKNFEQAYNHLNDIVKYLPKDHQARKMLAVSQLELGLVNDISTTLGDFQATTESDAQFLSSISYQLLELGAVNEAKDFAKKSAVVTSDNAAYNARQGILKLMMNDPSGMQDLANAVKLDPTLVEAELALAFASVQSGDTEQAQKIADKWKSAYPDKAGSYNLQASIYIKEQKFDQAETALKESLQKQPDNIFALIEQAKIAYFQKNDELTKSRVDHLIDIYPDNNKVLRLYFDVYRNEAALDKILSVIKAGTYDLDKTLILAESNAFLKKYDEAIRLLSSFENKKNLPKRYWQLLVFIYKQQKNIDKLRITLEKWHQASAHHIEPIVLLADYYKSSRKNKKAIKTINEGLEYHKDNLILQLVKMQLLLNKEGLPQAKLLYAKLANRNINEDLKQGLVGRIALLDEDYKTATPKLEAFYNAYPSSQNIIYLSASLQGQGMKSEAIKALEHHLKNNDSDNRIRNILASMYATEDEGKAISAYEIISKQQPNNVIVNNNLAWLYLGKGDIDKAMKYAKKAFEIAPEMPNVLDTYAQVLLKSGNNWLAYKKSEQAYQLSKGQDVDIALNYAEILINKDKRNEASAILKKINTRTIEQNSKKLKLLNRL